MTALAATPHDHARCVEDALGAAERVCARRSLSLTPLRRQVLEIIWGGHAPMGAYEILARMPRGKRATAPMTVYRALDFLVDAGLVHRIDSLNAFIGCPQAEAQHSAQLLVCRKCRRVEEIEDAGIGRALRRGSAAHAFDADFPLEIKGLCRDCQAPELS